MKNVVFATLAIFCGTALSHPVYGQEKVPFTIFNDADTYLCEFSLYYKDPYDREYYDLGSCVAPGKSVQVVLNTHICIVNMYFSFDDVGETKVTNHNICSDPSYHLKEITHYF